MLQHYIKISIRNLFRHRLNAIINIAGLAVSIAVFILIFRYIQNELSTDNFHEKRDRIFRLEWVEFSSSCSAGVKDVLMQQYPEVLNATRYFPSRNVQLEYEIGQGSGNIKSLKMDDILWADSTFLEIFTFPLLDGNPNTCLSLPYSIVLSEASAKKLFGEEDAMGKIVKLNNQYNFTVRGIMKDVDQPSSISVNGLMSLVTMADLRGEEFLQNLDNWFYATYVLLPKEFDSEKLGEDISAYVSKNYMNNRPVTFYLRSLKDIYFNQENASADYAKHGNMQFIRIFFAIALIIIFIAIINFINITTATASSRAKEVGIRKVSGAIKSKLIWQFLGETIIISIISVVFAVMITELIKPEFNNIIGKSLNIGYLENPLILLYLVLGGVVIGLLAGIYPAVYLTSFNPIQVLKGQIVKGRKGLVLRRVLIVLQFVISIVLIIGTIVISQQLRYLRNKDLGFNSDHIVYIDLNRDLEGNKEIFKQTLLQNPQIENVTFSNFKPGDMGGETYRRNVNEVDRQFYYTMTDPEFLDVFGLELVEGRNFHKNSIADAGTCIILNESAVKEFGLENPLGTQIYLFDTVGTVIGVVKDYHFKSLHNSIEPMSILYMPDWTKVCQIKISGENIPETIEYIESTFEASSLDFTFEYSFMDQGFDQLYKAEEKFAKIFTYFAILAIFIACLGLYGLISQIAVQRTREICVRKVNGATVLQIVVMLVKDLSIWVLLAFIIACPLAWYSMHKWLENFAFQTSIYWWIFIVAGLIAFAIAILTMSYRAIRAASLNPSDGLRYE